jgi:hypothetical protein
MDGQAVHLLDRELTNLLIVTGGRLQGTVGCGEAGCDGVLTFVCDL